MHYVEQGSGDPILFLHGNPSSAFSWRKVIPLLADVARCVAPDHMGFGKSDKPKISYSFYNLSDYLDAFVERLNLRNITLVVQDWGSPLGFDYFARHQSNVCGIVYFEAILKPFESWDMFPAADADPQSRQLFREFRTGDVNGRGWQLIVEQNMFIKALLPNLLGTQLTPQEMAEYEKPFERPEWRVPMWRLPKDIPIENSPPDVTVTVQRYTDALKASDVPKLLIYSRSGITLRQDAVDWSRANLRNLTVRELSGGHHFFQESHPAEFAQTIRDWYLGTRAGARRTGS
jgi:haloalkane dehalogenase